MSRFRTVLFLGFLSLLLVAMISPALAQEEAAAPEESAVETPAPVVEEPEVVIPTPEPEAPVVEEPEVVVPTPEPEAPVAASEPEQKLSPKFVVLLPEQIDRQWFWFYYTEEAQHIVQSAVEKALIDAGLDVMDLTSMDAAGSINDVISKDAAVRKAASMGADYAIVGTAVADKKSEGAAYGVTVIRATATITARIIRVKDGKILAVEEAAAEEGGQALKGASRDALQKAGRDIARKLARAAQGI